MLFNMPGQSPACVITVCASCLCTLLCEGMMISPRCCMSFSVSAVEADVLAGQN